MNEILNIIIGLILIIIGLIAMFGFVRYLPGNIKVLGLPIGLFLIFLGGWYAGWI